ncbi:unnamed protein product, partial [Laminaria digitata]
MGACLCGRWSLGDYGWLCSLLSLARQQLECQCHRRGAVGTKKHETEDAQGGDQEMQQQRWGQITRGGYSHPNDGNRSDTISDSQG